MLTNGRTKRVLFEKITPNLVKSRQIQIKIYI